MKAVEVEIVDGMDNDISVVVGLVGPEYKYICIYLSEQLKMILMRKIIRNTSRKKRGNRCGNHRHFITLLIVSLNLIIKNSNTGAMKSITL